ncbi:SoxR-reducing system protein RseC [Rouxiella badensis]|jgi:sigma-E factor negative regulatory protein RseC|uniref:SoxR-reducing system protein RseC n=1 Tax=Rouxiella badensis TaxID=1646377 RepID=UPI0017886E4B|nr:SoxR-reducing system protein RseC [Rouxiella badensis]MCC3702087.1 SoxR-reducing system protein RseC [Rouxiella badensis]MCC3717093.1 SoxR-reducing system protein RseC [Rouxiella badensis]MCC3728189.1 SoxR-reducing system protein RseC [Rouxiella badensis]MCC3732093.1 SoxR-reducing system protein RseC [Rouxiella badensis]MCC3739933.1 SoxR-reducing system protein RseC [Rouxiella badensis]
MMKEWATVISWQNGVAELRCETQAGCSSCHSRSGCGSRVLNELGPQTEHNLQVSSAEPLEPGQKVELGIMEGSLLRSALIVYMLPLFGVIFGGGVLQSLFKADVYALMGAVAGGAIGFAAARYLASKVSDKAAYQPVILQVGLPPNAFRFQPETK